MALDKEKKINLGIALKEIFKPGNEGISSKELGYKEAMNEILREIDLYYESGGYEGLGTIPEIERFIHRCLMKRFEED